VVNIAFHSKVCDLNLFQDRIHLKSFPRASGTAEYSRNSILKNEEKFGIHLLFTVQSSMHHTLPKYGSLVKIPDWPNLQGNTA
jgi:hypothetical protein